MSDNKGKITTIHCDIARQSFHLGGVITKITKSATAKGPYDFVYYIWHGNQIWQEIPEWMARVEYETKAEEIF